MGRPKPLRLSVVPVWHEIKEHRISLLLDIRFCLGPLEGTRAPAIRSRTTFAACYARINDTVLVRNRAGVARTGSLTSQGTVAFDIAPLWNVVTEATVIAEIVWTPEVGCNTGSWCCGLRGLDRGCRGRACRSSRCDGGWGDCDDGCNGYCRCHSSDA